MYSLIIFAPLFASIYVGIFNRSIDKKLASAITISGMVISTLISFYAFYDVAVLGNITHVILFKWISIASMNVNFSIYIDQLTSLMLIVVTSISTVVHIYSIGYMSSEVTQSRFMSYLSLFTFFMLMLVLSDNFLQLFLGWEGVGLCSYLLIGFYYTKKAANYASVKAFIVNRVGDFALILGVILLYTLFGAVDFDSIFANVYDFTDHKTNIFGTQFFSLEVACLLLFIGCMGKSAQIGLHVWLPDAMEGPTPVSALIHAATMVTAGVFLLARCSYIFEFAPAVKSFITVVGSITCVFAALIAICQNDIKKIIAYSTCSQLGYMFIAAGVGSYQAGIFHLYTHAFFKAMLFLAAGSVIHAVHEQNINKIGNLRKYMPITYALFVLGSFAIMGIYPLSGFYSKDLVLMSAYLADTQVGDFAFRMGIIGAFCTAIYSVKILLRVFHGKQIFKTSRKSLESGKVMIYPLYFLAIGSVAAGYIGYKILNIKTPIHGLFKKSIYVREYEIGEHANILIELLPLFVSIAGAIVGFLIYSSNISKYIAKSFNPIFRLLENKFYFDKIYEIMIVNVSDKFAKILKFLDKNFIDFIGPGFFSKISVDLSWCLSRFHNGIINNYAYLMVTAIGIGLTIIMYNFAL